VAIAHEEGVPNGCEWLGYSGCSIICCSCSCRMSSRFLSAMCTSPVFTPPFSAASRRLYAALRRRQQQIRNATTTMMKAAVRHTTSATKLVE